jgi:hypothetical protein
MDTAPNDFLDQIERFLRLSGMSASAFGWEAVKDRLFVFDLRKGRECRMATRRKVITWIDNYRPEKTEAAA